MDRLTVVGAGRVGQTLTRLVYQEGLCEIGEVFNQTVASATSATQFIGAGTAVVSVADLDLAATDLLMITTPDDVIEDYARGLAAGADDLTGMIVFHCSGALASSVLAPLRALGARIASVHPLKSFSTPAAAVKTFRGTYCAVEGDELAAKALIDLFSGIGGNPFTIDARTKIQYHAAVVVVCNYLYALLHIGFTIFEDIGVPQDVARKALAPLLEETVANAIRLGPAKALTGPIARGDHGVVGLHVTELLQHFPQFARAYAALGDVTASMAHAEGSFDEQVLARIQQALAKAPEGARR